jgi:hypothetical protein
LSLLSVYEMDSTGGESIVGLRDGFDWWRVYCRFTGWIRLVEGQLASRGVARQTCETQIMETFSALTCHGSWTAGHQELPVTALEDTSWIPHEESSPADWDADPEQHGMCTVFAINGNP